jgi:hypothetical protein
VSKIKSGILSGILTGTHQKKIGATLLVCALEEIGTP